MAPDIPPPKIERITEKLYDGGMSERPLQAPWRMEYIRSIDKPGNDSCFLCDAAKATDPRELRERLVLWTSAHCVVVINRYPYTNGHLLIAPKQHLDQLDELPTDVANDLTLQTARAIKLLKRAL